MGPKRSADRRDLGSLHRRLRRGRHPARPPGRHRLAQDDHGLGPDRVERFHGSRRGLVELHQLSGDPYRRRHWRGELRAGGQLAHRRPVSGQQAVAGDGYFHAWAAARPAACLFYRRCDGEGIRFLEGSFRHRHAARAGNRDRGIHDPRTGARRGRTRPDRPDADCEPYPQRPLDPHDVACGHSRNSGEFRGLCGELLHGAIDAAFFSACRSNARRLQPESSSASPAWSASSRAAG